MAKDHHTPESGPGFPGKPRQVDRESVPRLNTAKILSA